MKAMIKYAALAAAVALTCGTATAQSSSAAHTDEFSSSLRYSDFLKGADLRASKLVGSRVHSATGDRLGEIEELVIPSRDRDDMLVIVSVGGVLDVGDKRVALPYDDLRVSLDGNTFYFDRTEAQLETAPAFTYEAQAELQSETQRQPLRETTPVAAARTTAERARTVTPAAAKTDNVVLDVFDHRASELIGATVLDDRGESVAKVDDIVVSTEDGKLHAVLAIGGFAGFGAKHITMPFDDLQITADGGDPQVRIAMTGEQLEALVSARPEFRYERQVAQAPAAPRG